MWCYGGGGGYGGWARRIVEIALSSECHCLWFVRLRNGNGDVRRNAPHNPNTHSTHDEEEEEEEVVEERGLAATRKNVCFR